jgi:sterol 3beta-glucosyltransferase
LHKLHCLSASLVGAMALRGQRVAVIVEGSRGDCQPYVALSLGLKAQGCLVQYMSNCNHEQFVKDQGLDCVSAMADSEYHCQHNETLKASMKSGDTFKFIAALGEIVQTEFPGIVDKGLPALEAFKPDIVICGVLSVTLAEYYARIHDIPVIHAYLGVYFYTAQLAPFGLPNTGIGCINRGMWRLVLSLMMPTTRDQCNIIKAKVGNEDWLKFFPLSVNELIEDQNDPLIVKIVGCNAEVSPIPTDVISTNIHLTGWWTLDCAHQIERFNAGDPNFGGTDKVQIESFLRAGTTPVYLGWGSMLAVSPEFMTRLAVSALMKTKRRGIVLKGWGGLGPDLLVEEDLKSYARSNVLFVKSAPHEWLLPQCACAVIHGGSGSTAAAMRSGKPTIITPVFLDQYDFAKSCNRLKVGVGTCQFKEVTTDILAAAIDKCITDESVKKTAAQLAKMLKAENGVDRAIDLISAFVEGPLANGSWRRERAERDARRINSRRSFFDMFTCCGPMHLVWRKAR